MKSCVRSVWGHSAGQTLHCQSSLSATGWRQHLCRTPWKTSHPDHQAWHPGPWRCWWICPCPWHRPRWALAPRGALPPPPPDDGNWCSWKRGGFVGHLYHWFIRKTQDRRCLLMNWDWNMWYKTHSSWSCCCSFVFVYIVLYKMCFSSLCQCVELYWLTPNSSVLICGKGWLVLIVLSKPSYNLSMSPSISTWASP